MVVYRTLSAVALSAIWLWGCTSSNGTKAGDTTGGEPGPCGNVAEPCCMSGTLCSTGLTCSDQYCFTCAPAPAMFGGCTDVVVGGTATSGVDPGGVADDPTKALDDNVCTSWNYGNYGDPNAYWQVDLGASYPIDSLTLWPKMTPAEGGVQFLLQYKVNDADPFSAYPSPDGLFRTLYDYQPWQVAFDPPISMRFFRITFQGTPSFAALREVGLYTGCTR